MGAAAAGVEVATIVVDIFDEEGKRRLRPAEKSLRDCCGDECRKIGGATGQLLVAACGFRIEQIKLTEPREL